MNKKLDYILPPLSRARKESAKHLLKLALASPDFDKATRFRETARQRLPMSFKDLLMLPIVSHLPLHNTGMSDYFFSQLEASANDRLQKLEARAFSAEFMRDMMVYENLRDELRIRPAREQIAKLQEHAQIISVKYASLDSEGVSRFVRHDNRRGNQRHNAVSAALFLAGSAMLIGEFVFKVPFLRKIGYILPAYMVAVSPVLPFLKMAKEELDSYVAKCQHTLLDARETARKSLEGQPGTG